MYPKDSKINDGQESLLEITWHLRKSWFNAIIWQRDFITSKFSTELRNSQRQGRLWVDIKNLLRKDTKDQSKPNLLQK